MRRLSDHLVVPARPALAELMIRSGLLSALREQPDTATGIAERMGFDRRATERCLEAGAALGMCVRDENGQFSALPTSLPWSGLDAFLRTGELAIDLDHRPTREAAYAQFVDQLGERFAAETRALARRLAPANAILDVGAGAGLWSLAMAASDPETTVTAFDLPAVLPRFLANAERLGLADRVSGVSGSWNEDALPSGFDRVVLAAVLHLEDTSGAQVLLEKAVAALRPGGELLIVDVFPEQMPEPIVSVYALHLALRLRTGTVHRAESILAACAAAGLASHEWLRLDPDASAVALRVW